MSTGSIQTPSKTLFKHLSDGLINKTFTASADIVEGLPVKITGNGLVAPAVANDNAIGTCIKGGLATELVTIAVSKYAMDALVEMTVGPASAGQLVTYTGVVNANGVPQVIIAASASYAKGVVLVGGAATTEIRIGVLTTPILVP